ncbi:hypothetical protein BGZ52_003706 [Haplosporangium bisporale]|nr:hypothetical protein BGZ52_003706 [Haplosporangium bisporale]
MATSSGSPPVQLPARPAPRDTQKVNPVRSPLSAAARPALPPRTLTDSFVDTPSSPGSNINKDSYQIQDSAAPAPKLTTFSRPRSARTAKSTSPVESKPPAIVSNNISTPPKLPSRSTASTPSNKPTDTGPVRFSPAPPRNDLGIENTAAAAALPAITRNSQPIPLPSRNILNNSSSSSPSGFTRAPEANGSPQDGGSPDLIDIDNAGRLSKAQFCMGLYLIDERLASGTIPLEVSDELWVSAMQ